MSRGLMIKLISFALAASLLVAMGLLLHKPLDEQSRSQALSGLGKTLSQKDPAVALMRVAPGGLRAPMLSFLWIRSQNLHQAGRHFDAMQLARMICKLQPRFPGVWSFQAWQMAWNISATTHTPRERWLWVSNGLQLLRDEGIPLNPRALTLYKELGWIFYFKIGGYMDEMHMVYKQRWISQMHWLLGAAPYTTTEQAIEAFEPITRAPLNRDPALQGKTDIQQDRLTVLRSDPKVAQYLDRLGEFDVGADRSFLDAYNRFSNDPAVSVTRTRPPEPDTPRDRAVSDLINGEQYQYARGKVLAFIRAQMLWNVYKMDPQWMLGLMKKYDVPLDWRLPWSHGLYWITYGIHVCESLEMSDINAKNTDRIALFCLTNLTFSGRVMYFEHHEDPDKSFLQFMSDWRYVEPTHRQFIEYIKALTGEAPGRGRDNPLRTGHKNYLIGAIEMLYALQKYEESQKYFQWVKEHYDPKDSDWDLPLEDFVLARFRRGAATTQEQARAYIYASLTTAMVKLASNDMDEHRAAVGFARKVYIDFRENSARRYRMPPFERIRSFIAAHILVRPRLLGYRVPLIDRVRLYKALDDNVKLQIYDVVAPFLKRECREQGLDFDSAFPAPSGIERYRRRWREEFGAMDY